MEPVAPLQIEKRRRGRPRKLPVDLATLRDLNMSQAIERCRELGRPVGRARLQVAIAQGLVEAGYEPTGRLTRMGQPLLLVVRASLEAWLARPLRPYVPPQHGKGAAATAPRSRG